MTNRHTKRSSTLLTIRETQIKTTVRYHQNVYKYTCFDAYQGWNRSPAQVGCMRQVLGAGALGGPRGMGWGGRWEGVLGWGIHVNPWLIHVNVWQKPLQYCKLISLQLIKINGKKCLQITNIGVDFEKRDPLYTIGRNVNWCSPVENSMEVSQNIKNRTTIWLSNSTSGCISDKIKKSNLKRYLHPSVHSCIIYNSQTWEHPKCPSTHEWINKWFIYLYIYIYLFIHTHTHTHTMKYYSVIRKEEIFAICSNINGLGEYYVKWNKSGKDKYFMLSLICEI